MSANIKASTDGTQAIIGVGGVDQMTISNAGVVTANSFVGTMNSSSVTATGSTAARTLQDRFADVVNVLDFGAFNNNTNPSATTTAIQNAINSGKSVYLPSGTYQLNVGAILKTNADGQMIFGDGKNSTIIIQGTIQIKNSNCTIKDIQMYGNATYGILIDDDRTIAQRQASYSTRYGATISGVNINNKTYGIAITDTGFYDRIVDCFLSGNDHGIWMANDQMVPTPLYSASWDRGDTIVSDNYISSNAITGIWLKNHGTILASNNKIIGNGNGIKIQPDRSGGRDERVMQLFSSNNSIENSNAARIFTITSIVNNGSGDARVTVTGNHLLPETHTYRINISGTTNYNGFASATWVSATQFDIDKSYVANESSGQMSTIIGWDLYVPDDGIASVSNAYCNIHGGDINQFNIENGANWNINNVNVKYQRRYGDKIDNFKESALINGINAAATPNAINLFASGNYLPENLTSDYVLLDNRKQFTNGIQIDKTDVLAGGSSGGSQQPSIPNTNGNIFSGKYTPSATGVTNVATGNITCFESYFCRIGDYVIVSGSITIDPTSSGITEWRITLPVSTNLEGANQLNGTFCTYSSGDQDTDTGCILGFTGATNDQAIFRATLTNSGSTAYSFMFGYVVL